MRPSAREVRRTAASWSATLAVTAGESEAFWSEAARALRWRTPPQRVLDKEHPERPRWFAGGELNTCENALDVHVDSGRGDQPRARLGQRRHRVDRALHVSRAARRGGALRGGLEGPR